MKKFSDFCQVLQNNSIFSEVSHYALQDETSFKFFNEEIHSLWDKMIVSAPNEEVQKELIIVEAGFGDWMGNKIGQAGRWAANTANNFSQGVQRGYNQQQPTNPGTDVPVTAIDAQGRPMAAPAAPRPAAPPTADSVAAQAQQAGGGQNMVGQLEKQLGAISNQLGSNPQYAGLKKVWDDGLKNMLGQLRQAVQQNGTDQGSQAGDWM